MAPKPTLRRNILANRSLEREVNRQLRAARTASAQIRVAATYIRRRRGLDKLRSVRVQVVHAKSRQQWVAEVRVIEDIEEIAAKFHRHGFGQVRCLGQREVEIRIARRIEGVAALAAWMPPADAVS